MKCKTFLSISLQEDGKDDYIKGLPAKFGPLEVIVEMKY